MPYPGFDHNHFRGFFPDFMNNYNDMVKYGRNVLITLAILFASQLICFADEPVLYISNQPYTKPLATRAGVLYAAADDIFPILQLNLKSQGRVLCAATPNYTGPLCPKDLASSFLYVNGMPIIRGVVAERNKIWISLPALAKAIGYIYQYNQDTQIADLIRPVVVLPIQASESTGAKPGDNKSTKKNEKADEKEEAPVEVQDVSEFMDSVTFEYRLAFNVKNVSDKTVKGITAMVTYLDGYGKAIFNRVFNIGTLSPGSVAKQNDYWVNTTQIYGVKAKIELNWEGKKKD